MSGWYTNIRGETIRRTARGGGVGADYVKDWESAVAYLSRGRSDIDRPLANNTRLIAKWHCLRDRCIGIRKRYPTEDRPCIHVRLHQTNIITYHFDGSFTLNSGGWKTPTTKDRMNRFTPVWLGVGSERRYIPMAERVRHARRLLSKSEDIETIKNWARDFDKHESYWVAERRWGFIPWEDRDEDDDRGWPALAWEHYEAVRFVDGIELLPPDAPELARLPARPLNLDYSRRRSKLGSTARLASIA